jgi:putative Mn2+ efflux pump MntP
MPGTLELLILGAVIGSNNFAAALALGALGQGHHRQRIVLVFTSFEFVIPLIGIWIGERFSRSMATPADWVGPLILALIGLWTVRSGIRHSSDDERLSRRAASWRGLVVMAALLSLDNLIIGFSLGLRHFNPLLIASVIAVFSAAFTWFGLGVGSAARRNWERHAKTAAGSLLLLISGAIWTGVIS